jgi:hypothetical protein
VFWSDETLSQNSGERQQAVAAVEREWVTDIDFRNMAYPIGVRNVVADGSVARNVEREEIFG